MFDTISCEAHTLTQMYQNRYIYNTIMNSNACVEYGLDFLTVKKKVASISDRRKTFIVSIFPSVTIAALCNTLAIVHKKIVLNKAKRVYISDDLIINLQTATLDENGQITNNSSTKLQQSNDTSNFTAPTDNKSTIYLSSYIEPLVSQILPTKTFLNAEEEMDHSNQNQVKDSAATIIENVIYDVSQSEIELNSRFDVPTPSPTQCILILSNDYYYYYFSIFFFFFIFQL